MLNQIESNLRSIVYLSTATKPMSAAEIETLLDSARNFNATTNVTGVLMYLDGSFVQYIEGTESGLHKVCERIFNSHKHKNIMKIMEKSIASRIFPDWLMGSTTITNSELFKLQALDVQDRFNSEATTVKFLKTIIENERNPIRFSYSS
jgi:hypothetical protein